MGALTRILFPLPGEDVSRDRDAALRLARLTTTGTPTSLLTRRYWIDGLRLGSDNQPLSLASCMTTAKSLTPTSRAIAEPGDPAEPPGYPLWQDNIVALLCFLVNP